MQSKNEGGGCLLCLLEKAILKQKGGNPEGGELIIDRHKQGLQINHLQGKKKGAGGGNPVSSRRTYLSEKTKNLTTIARPGRRLPKQSSRRKQS